MLIAGRVAQCGSGLIWTILRSDTLVWCTCSSGTLVILSHWCWQDDLTALFLLLFWFFSGAFSGLLTGCSSAAPLVLPCYCSDSTHNSHTLHFWSLCPLWLYSDGADGSPGGIRAAGSQSTGCSPASFCRRSCLIALFTLSPDAKTHTAVPTISLNWWAVANFIRSERETHAFRSQQCGHRYAAVRKRGARCSERRIVERSGCQAHGRTVSKIRRAPLGRAPTQQAHEIAASTLTTVFNRGHSFSFCSFYHLASSIWCEWRLAPYVVLCAHWTIFSRAHRTGASTNDCQRVRWWLYRVAIKATSTEASDPEKFHTKMQLASAQK